MSALGWRLLPKMPEKRPAKAASSTLLVFCDLTCDWNLDGLAKGRIEAGASAREKVDPGQHLVVAATEDRVDQFKQISELKPAEQTVLTTSLKPLRDARLKSNKRHKPRRNWPSNRRKKLRESSRPENGKNTTKQRRSRQSMAQLSHPHYPQLH